MTNIHHFNIQFGTFFISILAPIDHIEEKRKQPIIPKYTEVGLGAIAGYLLKPKSPLPLRLTISWLVATSTACIAHPDEVKSSLNSLISYLTDLIRLRGKLKSTSFFTSLHFSFLKKLKRLPFFGLNQVKWLITYITFSHLNFDLSFSFTCSRYNQSKFSQIWRNGKTKIFIWWQIL